MKLVTLMADDIAKFEAKIPKASTPLPDLHREILEVDGITMTLVRAARSNDPRTNTYSIEFLHDEVKYVLIVRPTVEQIPSITLTRVDDNDGDFVASIASYTVLDDTVTTLKGELPMRPSDSRKSRQSRLGSFDLAALLENLKIK